MWKEDRDELRGLHFESGWGVLPGWGTGWVEVGGVGWLGRFVSCSLVGFNLEGICSEFLTGLDYS